MEKLRPFLAVVLGLTLWVHGLAIAAAPVATVAAASAAEMPCHGDQAPSAASCDCCDSGCADMMSCATGSIAGTPFVPVPVVPPLHAAIAVRGWTPQTAVLPLPLRPPIVSHA